MKFPPGLQRNAAETPAHHPHELAAHGKSRGSGAAVTQTQGGGSAKKLGDFPTNTRDFDDLR